MDKRIYRKGWYIEHSQKIISPENNLIQNNKICNNFHSVRLPAIQKSFIDTNVITHKRKQKDKSRKADSVDKTQQSTGDEPPFTYRDARKNLAAKGCEPDEDANRLYWLAFISLPLVFLGGIGFILAAIVFFRTKSAKEKVISEGGNCEPENLAIVAAARRNAGGLSALGLFVLLSAILAVVIFVFVL